MSAAARPAAPATRFILARVAARWGVSPGEITGPSRRASIVAARRVAQWMMRRAGRRLRAIGAGTGRSHHSVVHSLRRVERQAAADAAFAARIEADWAGIIAEWRGEGGR